MHRTHWLPVLDGALAERARNTIEDIAGALRDPVDDPSLGHGNAGRALFFGYLAELWPERGLAEVAQALLDTAIDQLAERALAPSLYGGFAGIAWVVEHLQRRIYGAPDDDDPGAAIDRALVDVLAQSPWPAEFDLISGLAGIGVYALERLPRVCARDCLAAVVDRLAELALARADGVTWWTRPELLMAESRIEFPDGYFDLGVAHGVPAVTVVLAGACAAGVRRERASQLLGDAMRWMLAARLSDDAPSALPVVIAAGRTPRPARAAWCYGDPGAALAWYAAASAVRQPHWHDAALALGQRAAARPIADGDVVDAGLCHGAAGLAVLFDRLGQSTGNAAFRATARSWYARTLALRRHEGDACGYRALRRDPASPTRATTWVDDRSLLTGIAGIGLALIEGLSPLPPDWHRLLAASLAPTQAFEF